MGNCPSGDYFDCPLYINFYWMPQMALPPLNGDPNSITFSGFASGSTMSQLLHIVHSDTIKGVGLNQGSPYGSTLYDVDTIEKWDDLIQKALKDEKIDASLVDNFKKSPVMIFSGSNDETMLPVN